MLCVCECCVCSLFVDMGDNDKALKEFDNVMQHSLCDGNIYAVIDSASLLWRLEVR